MPQIALVSDEHNDDVGIGMISKLLEPARHVFVGLVLADIVDEEGSNRTAVVCGGDGTVTLLSSSVPNLSFNGLGVDLN